MIAIGGYYVELWDLAYFGACIVQGIIVLGFVIAYQTRNAA